MGPEHYWNDAIFLLTMKSLSNEGSIEPLASVNYGLSPEYKRRKARGALRAMEKHQRGLTSEQQQFVMLHRHQGRSHSIPDNFRHHEYHEKELPVKKTEHSKLKIVPKKIYDGLQ